MQSQVNPRAREGRLIRSVPFRSGRNDTAPSAYPFLFIPGSLVHSGNAHPGLCYLSGSRSEMAGQQKILPVKYMGDDK